MSINPDKSFVKSNGIDLPIMYVYLAGRIAGECIKDCLEWRQAIINHYGNYKNNCAYPIAFLDALNSKESDSIDNLGLTSSLPPNLIWDKDIFSLEKSNVVVANMDDFFEDDIDYLLEVDCFSDQFDYKKNFFKLLKKISNRRENLGTISEVAIALYLHKPTILIVPNRRKEIFEKHPFTKRASIIVTSVGQLLDEKWLQILYKAFSGAIYNNE
jgi:hypothetical protein